MFIGLLCICCPFRTYINRQVKTNSVLEDETSYESRFLQFQSDYDRENPLTKKKGDLRVLDLKI